MPGATALQRVRVHLAAQRAAGIPFDDAWPVPLATVADDDGARRSRGQRARGMSRTAERLAGRWACAAGVLSRGGNGELADVDREPRPVKSPDVV